MKNKLLFLAVLMMALAIPQKVFAYDIYDFSAIAPTGQCLFYRILNGSYYVVEVSAPCVNESWVGYAKPTGDLTIPDSVIHNGQTYCVKSIRGKAFENCTGLTSVTIPSSIQSIGARAFKDCIGLTSVTFNASNCTTASNNSYAFTDRAFVGCDSITVFTFGDNVYRIPMYLCAGLPKLTSITIPNLVCYINKNAFKDCIGLNYVTFNATNCSTTATNPSEAPFSGCDSITVFTFGDNIQSIPNYLCAGGLSNLTSITIPNLITSIGEYAFHYCSGLISITSLAIVPPQCGPETFRFVDHQIPVYVPCSSISAYQSSEEWMYFSNIICNSSSFTITVTSANTTMGTVSGDGSYYEGTTATLTATANTGYHFTHWQDGNTQNPRTITVTGDATYTAYFEVDGGNDDCPTITSFPWNATFDEDLTCWKTVDADGDGYNWMNYQDFVVSESYSYFDGTNQGLTPDNWLISQRIQIPSSGTYSLSWTARGLTNDYYNEHYSVYVSTTGDNPSDFTTPLFSETLNTPNAVNRSKSLANYRGQTIRIAFRHHNTNDVFVLGIGNIKIAQGTQGIEDADESGVSIYAEYGNIHINDVAGQNVTVYAIDGRIIATKTSADEQCSISVPSAGVYMVKVGSHPARRVVVIR